VKEGHGVWKSPKGDKYEGLWANNRQNGKGILTHRYSIFKGTFKGSLKHGKGEEKFSNGDNYVGEYKDGKHHGWGRYEWK
jgi:hypothetical protein